MSALASVFDELPILSYLGLPDRGYEPSPQTAPIDFLIKHLRHLPPHLLLRFSSVTNPKQRTVIPTIRNRRLKYSSNGPSELSFSSARRTWPALWDGRQPHGQGEGEDEKAWAKSEFLQGSNKHVGKLGDLLGEYEEERVAARLRTLREQPVQGDFVPEEESDSDDEDNAVATEVEQENVEEEKASFERLVRERFIYGLLEAVDYDAVDWDDGLDSEYDREAEEQWFNEEDEEL